MTIPLQKNPKICFNNIFDYNPCYQLQKLEFRNETILVIDNCYINPIAVRNFLLTTPCFPAKQVDGSNYPGYRSETQVEMGMVNLVNALSKQYYPSMNLLDNFNFIGGIISTKTVHEDTSHLIHIDGQGLAGLVYLNVEEECSGGTAFFNNHIDKASSLKIDMKFNRLILYPMHLFHSGWIEPNSFHECYRLTQNIFLYTKKCQE